MGIYINNEFYFPEYVLNSKPIFILAFIFYAFITINMYRKNKLNLINATLYLLFITYIAIVISLTLFPINIFLAGSPIYGLGLGKQLLINLSISDLLGYSSNKIQIFGNLALLVPLTFFLALTNPKYANYKFGFILGMIGSFTIEFLQFIMSFFYLGSRVSDINDIILNSLGALFGVLLYKIFYKFFKEQIDSIHHAE